MKHLFGFVFALALMSMSLTATAQVVYPLNADSIGELSEVAECTLPKETVYKNALELATKKGRIVLRDDENNKILFDCTHHFSPRYQVVQSWLGSMIAIVDENIQYRVTVECKEGRYRIKVNNISFKYREKYVDIKKYIEVTKQVNQYNNPNHYYIDAKDKVERLKKKDTSKMKKKELEKYNTDLELAQQALEYFTALSQTEYDIIIAQINQMKERLSFNDDF